jgi:hypothetical protein
MLSQCVQALAVLLAKSASRLMMRMTCFPYVLDERFLLFELLIASRASARKKKMQRISLNAVIFNR